ncbi:MAG TPA: hypothetical protein VF857_02705, partial [Spirochaetota bacterium]
MFSGKAVPFAMLLFLLIVCAIAPVRAEAPAVQSIVTVGSKNFETPEDAIKYFVSRLAANDLPGAFEACAINEIDRFDFGAYTKRLQAFIFWQSPAPSNSLMFRQMNRIMRINQISGQIKIMIYSML